MTGVSDAMKSVFRSFGFSTTFKPCNTLRQKMVNVKDKPRKDKISQVLIGWKRYSSLAKMRRVVVYVKRFLNNTRTKKEERLTGPLAVPELRSAQNYLVKRAQPESLGEEVQLLEKDREIHKRSRIKSLDPRLEDGYLVVGYRKPRPYHTVRDIPRSLNHVMSFHS